MPFLLKNDLFTHLNVEIIDEITRGDDTKVARAITAAIGEAKGYLSRFDLLKIFGDVNTEPEVSEENIETGKDFIKQIACWKLIKLGNPNINIELFKTGYDEAIKWFDKIQKGTIDPPGWPYRVDDPETPVAENASVQWSSNVKRTNHY